MDLLSPPDGLNEPSSVIHRLIFGDEGDDTAAVPQVEYETIVDFALRLHRATIAPNSHVGIDYYGTGRAQRHF